jgi:hypothetical protein
MTGKRLDYLPSNVLRWICDMKEETSFTKESTVKLVKSKENPTDLLTRFTTQTKCGYEDSPWSKAGFDIMGKYEGSHSEENCFGPDYPSPLDFIAGCSLLLQLIVQELGQTVVSLRKQLSDELKLEFERSRTNLEALFGKAKTKEAHTYTRAIESKDWVLGHPEIDCLARNSNLEIVIHPEKYGFPTGCKMMHIYNKAPPPPPRQLHHF